MMVIMNEQWKAVKGWHREMVVIPNSDVNKDLQKCVAAYFPQLSTALNRYRRSLPRHYGFKFNLRFYLLLKKFSFVSEEFIELDQWFSSESELVLVEEHIVEKLRKSIRKVLARFDAFVKSGSGWVLKQVLAISVAVYKFRLFRGGCMRSQLPAPLRKSKSIVCSAAAKDNKCFLRALWLGLQKKGRKNTERFNKTGKRFVKFYQRFLPSDPNHKVDLRDIVQFEKCCPVSINIYGFEKGLFPHYISTKVTAPVPGDSTKRRHVDLLLHDGHFHAIRNLSSLVKKGNRKHTRRSFVCRACLSTFATHHAYQFHLTVCLGNGKRRFEPPKQEDAVLSFQGYSKLIEAPFVIYADLESSIQVPESCHEEGKKTLSTRSHGCISWASTTICRPNSEFSSLPIYYTGSDSVDTFLNHLEAEFDRISDILEQVNVPLVMSAEDEFVHDQTQHCYMCQKLFTEPGDKVRDHCHLSGRYRHALCQRCNLTYAKQRSKVYVLMHGLCNYDSHFIVQALSRYDDKNLRVIPRTGEKYLTFSVGNLVFKDSYQFLNASLSTLVQNLRDKGEHYFQNVRCCFANPKQQELLFQKGIFPYNYITSLDVLKETQLPPREYFFNDLSQLHVSEKDYTFAQTVWKAFECRTLEDYLHVYLLADVLLLADCFENFRTTCLQDYELDPVHYFSNPHMSFDAFLRRSGVEIDLFTDVDMYMFISSAIRGGISMVSKRYSEANNKHLVSYDESKPSTYILDIDKNNLYGKCMMEYLPYRNFSWVQNVTPSLVTEILNTSPTSQMGYILECRLLYPEHLHDDHADYPLAPEKKAVDFESLSPFAQWLCKRHDLKKSTKTEKLMGTLHDKDHYVLHYRCLQLYVKLGLKLDKVYKVLKFEQAPIIKDYVEFNTMKRAESKNAFDTALYKLFVNSIYGKTMENPANKSRTILATSVETFEKNVAKLTFKNSRFITEDIVSLEMDHPKLKINKPIFLGFAILEFAKLHMFDFHYTVMKAHFANRLQLLYTDTDSFVYEIQSTDLYAELAQLPADEFDFSNYPPDHPLFSTRNKRVPGKFKDECAGKQIKSFVGLRSKMYSLKMDRNEEEELKRAKGVKQAVVSQDLKYDDYVNCLKDNQQMEHEFHAIRSKSHHVYTAHQTKVSLSPFDDKRWLLNSIDSLPYGHYTLTSPQKIVPVRQKQLRPSHKTMAYQQQQRRFGQAGRYAYRPTPFRFNQQQQQQQYQQPMAGELYWGGRLKARNGYLGMKIQDWGRVPFIHFFRTNKQNQCLSLSYDEYMRLSAQIPIIDERMKECKQHICQGGEMPPDPEPLQDFESLDDIDEKVAAEAGKRKWCGGEEVSDDEGLIITHPPAEEEKQPEKKRKANKKKSTEE